MTAPAASPAGLSPQSAAFSACVPPNGGQPPVPVLANARTLTLLRVKRPRSLPCSGSPVSEESPGLSSSCAPPGDFAGVSGPRPLCAPHPATAPSIFVAGPPPPKRPRVAACRPAQTCALFRFVGSFQDAVAPGNSAGADRVRARPQAAAGADAADDGARAIMQLLTAEPTQRFIRLQPVQGGAQQTQPRATAELHEPPAEGPPEFATWAPTPAATRFGKPEPALGGEQHETKPEGHAVAAHRRFHPCLARKGPNARSHTLTEPPPAKPQDAATSQPYREAATSFSAGHACASCVASSAAPAASTSSAGSAYWESFNPPLRRGIFEPPRGAGHKGHDQRQPLLTTTPSGLGGTSATTTPPPLPRRSSVFKAPIPIKQSVLASLPRFRAVGRKRRIFSVPAPDPEERQPSGSVVVYLLDVEAVDADAPIEAVRGAAAASGPYQSSAALKKRKANIDAKEFDADQMSETESTETSWQYDFYALENPQESRQERKRSAGGGGRHLESRHGMERASSSPSDIWADLASPPPAPSASDSTALEDADDWAGGHSLATSGDCVGYLQLEEELDVLTGAVREERWVTTFQEDFGDLDDADSDLEAEGQGGLYAGDTSDEEHGACVSSGDDGEGEFLQTVEGDEGDGQRQKGPGDLDETCRLMAALRLSQRTHKRLGPAALDGLPPSRGARPTPKPRAGSCSDSADDDTAGEREQEGAEWMNDGKDSLQSSGEDRDEHSNDEGSSDTAQEEQTQNFGTSAARRVAEGPSTLSVAFELRRRLAAKTATRAQTQWGHTLADKLHELEAMEGEYEKRKQKNTK
eukprot:GHVT01050324.1.p1 GENE.GHVT01050324.1~~GHVT01050324.1.p1  ORF type:complete len:811 (+),score=194.37 GHVT01050324.1:219-2651(+)